MTIGWLISTAGIPTPTEFSVAEPRPVLAVPPTAPSVLADPATAVGRVTDQSEKVGCGSRQNVG